MTVEHGDGTTHFGYETVPETEKARKVAGVFDSVATRYDVMNDLMSAGLHRLWKRYAVERSQVRRGDRVLDVAGGTGDLTRLFRERVGDSGLVVLTDINNAMLSRGRDRLIDEGVAVPALQCDAEKLPFPDNHFNLVSVAFGLRNMTHKDKALAESDADQARRQAAGAGVLQGGQASGKSLRLVQLQYPAPHGQAGGG